MMLGIFGDSFADFSSIYTPTTTESAWFNILAKKLNCGRGLHGQAGTSVYQAYKNFLSIHKRYRVAVFIISDHMRYTKSLRFEFDEQKDLHSVTSIERLQNLRKTKPLTENDKQRCDWLEGYFKMDDEEYKLDMTELMIQHMTSLNPNTIFYPGFLTYSKSEVPEKYRLVNLVYNQWEHFKIKPEEFLNYTETTNVVGHMVPEYNKAFADVLYSKITTGKYDFSYFDNVVIKGRKSEYYVEK